MAFTIHLRPTEHGLLSKVMAGAGDLPQSFMIQAGNHTAIMAIGFTLTTAGIGIQIIRGAGRLFIMAAGFIMTATAGAGIQTPFGDLPGFAGVTRMIIAAGRRCRRIANIAKALASSSTARM